jgi:hypothetical protein
MNWRRTPKQQVETTCTQLTDSERSTGLLTMAYIFDMAGVEDCPQMTQMGTDWEPVFYLRTSAYICVICG